MIISKQITPYVVYYEDSIQHALQKISRNTRRLVYCVSDGGVLEGLVTDGDFRRWVVETKEIDLLNPVRLVANTKFISKRDDYPYSKIKELFSSLLNSKELSFFLHLRLKAYQQPHVILVLMLFLQFYNVSY